MVCQIQQNYTHGILREDIIFIACEKLIYDKRSQDSSAVILENMTENHRDVCTKATIHFKILIITY